MREIFRKTTSIAAWAAILPAFLVIRCTVEAPKAPTWEVRLEAPLISRHYGMYELIDRLDEEALSYDSNGNIALHFEEALDPITVEAGLSVPDLVRSFAHELGALTVTAPDPLNIEVAVTGLAAGEIPPGAYDAGLPFPAIDDFQSATFSGGKLYLTVANHLELPLDSVTVRIVDTYHSTTVAQFVVPGGLGVNQTWTDSLDLAGRTLSGQLGFDSRLHTTGGTLLSAADKYLGSTLAFSEQVTASEAMARVPAQEKRFDDRLLISSSHRLSQAGVSAGNLDIDISNASALACEVRVEVPRIEAGGQILVLVGNVPAYSQVNLHRALSGVQLLPDLSGDSMALGLETQAYLPGSGGDYLSFHSTDQIQVSATLSGLQFSDCAGIIAPTTVSLPGIVQRLELPKGMEHVSLNHAAATLRVYSEIDVPTNIAVQVLTEADRSLDLHTALTGGTQQNPGLTTVVIDDPSSLTEPVPSQLTISGSAVVGDGVTAGAIYTGSRIWGDLSISSPLRFALGPSEFLGDVNSTKIDQQDIEDVADRLLEASVDATFNSHLPLGARVTLYFSGDSAVLYTGPQLTLGPFPVKAGTIDAEGLVSEAVATNLTVHLSEGDLQIIRNPILYLGARISLPGTQGQTVSVLSSDYLEIQANLNINVRLGGE